MFIRSVCAVQKWRKGMRFGKQNDKKYIIFTRELTDRSRDVVEGGSPAVDTGGMLLVEGADLQAESAARRSRHSRLHAGRYAGHAQGSHPRPAR